MMFKGCSRCGGNMYLEEEGRFRDLVCLQCGNRRPEPAPTAEEVERAAREEAAAQLS